MGGRSRTGAFARAGARGVGTELIELLCELSGEVRYQQYVDGWHRRRFPERGIMTRREYERWRTELQEKRSTEARC
ncbi:MAG: putative selenoprotein [Pyrinomonadaceae bacterium]|nr:putative selenoprotein [Pyrinomonadaceae bacterium]